MSFLMNLLPKMSFRRTMLIAQRDFFGYVKTWGFWLTALGPFIGLFFGIFAPILMAKSEPVQYVTIFDETGLHASEIESKYARENHEIMVEAIKGVSKYSVPRAQKEEFESVLTKEGPEAAKDFIREHNPKIAGFLDMPEQKMKFVPPPKPSIEALKLFVKDDGKITLDGEDVALLGAMHIFEENGETKAEYWTKIPTQNTLRRLTTRYFSKLAMDGYLHSGGLNREAYRAVSENSLNVETYNPAKSSTENGGQAVTAKDKIPYFVAAGLSMLLWFAVFTGAYMLLMSMVEEKINKVLEMLLATTRFSEIFVGKLIGVAALTVASLLPWIILGGIGFVAAIQFGDGAIADGLMKAMTVKMLIFLPIFFILGYVFYGSMFIALGALADSMQDASTLMTPMVMLLLGSILIVPVGIAFPDSPLLMAAQYIPFSAPFAAIVRLPADPPLWQTLMSVVVLVLSSAFVVWFSARLFKHGVLTGGGMASLKAWFKKVVSIKRGA